MKEQNIIIISLDEVRPDHLSCYGYKKNKTPAIDKIAREGVLFETCISSSDFTPIAMGSVITGKYPNKHGMRNPFCKLHTSTIATILKKNNYMTAGFVGNGLLSSKHQYSNGFDFWHECIKETSWSHLDYDDGTDKIFYEGYWWPDDFFSWLKENKSQPFFLWGHLYETHENSEHELLQKGLIKENELSDHGYYDAKIKLADKEVINRLLITLEDLGIRDNTIIVIMSDHGTNLGEHEVDPIPWRDGRKTYPQHTTMYDCDLRVVMIIVGGGLPKNKRIKGMVRSVDLVPTLLELAGIPTTEENFDGESLLPVINSGSAKNKLVYSEDLFEPRGRGALQSLRTDKFKYIRNSTIGEEEYYDLEVDPEEKNNIISQINSKQLREELAQYLQDNQCISEFPEEDEKKIKENLRLLGYFR
ncbi:hypothetical protein A2331_04110 [Candidatus Falkowbacteria bacterium RIFOXYB2_FULL_34_18]|uniref:Sulfatase N-terminal domain-containing protein n=1 Tax=Candidatus Falkowbacteria bacterium RIFOXYD2_FULL_34_120 TaxID=1798007 RepID=A0A1F5TRT3_9BACT|nr:MAG: hypothetical protein A2331_04110 [Candidatus Falkowbacteria bacterium RIFOXYB2_FULL_34_18]OGF29723.1 MAG: hypothetical protein A2500_00415 [Candidatus Falkowbacteria bacterium RIFOXYC12_FULL_34_55]OGF37412.1 MAG: hypothetical protein A2466_00305 [Candidatus Falkowbacteria bacterium RIFOXYC2_FULL_34_220]OGF39137.1 MAG: hypothetical protein A2515_00260 [Candidatus Falkowbacteria bacterium RIFOXYD12_FULL_34_57]OGF41686.1 MAG: hypothetical protein A2531_05980 [Candidatus Falkowbacteria bact